MTGCTKKALLAASFFCLAALPAFAEDTSKTHKVDLSGRAFEYQVAGYHICLAFTGEDTLRWVYLAAPGEEAGKTADERFDRRDLRADIVMLAWTEASGANITDVFDFGEMALHASFITPDGKRFLSDANITERADCNSE